MITKYSATASLEGASIVLTLKTRLTDDECIGLRDSNWASKLELAARNRNIAVAPDEIRAEYDPGSRKNYGNLLDVLGEKFDFANP